MTKAVQAIPDAYRMLIPYMAVRGAADAIDFYKRAFGAQERYQLPGPDGKVGHAELTIGESVLMLAEESPEFGHRSPQSLNGTPIGLVLYVEDVDAAFERAIAAGATALYPVEDKFYGDRAGGVTDPFGYQWSLMTHIEDVSPEEMQKRMEAEFAKAPAPAQ